MLSPDGNFVFHFLNVLIYCWMNVQKQSPWVQEAGCACSNLIDGPGLIVVCRRVQQGTAKPQLTHWHPGLFVSRALDSPS